METTPDDCDAGLAKLGLVFGSLFSALDDAELAILLYKVESVEADRTVEPLSLEIVAMDKADV